MTADPKRDAVREVVNAAIELVRVDDGAAWQRLKKSVDALLRMGWGEQQQLGGVK